jgi:hypothetical protein
VSEAAGIEPRTVAPWNALTAKRSNHSAISHPQNFEIVSGGEILLKIFFTLLSVKTYSTYTSSVLFLP